MSEIKTVTRWNGLLVDQYTDTSTGQIEIRSAEAIIGTGIKGDLLAISTGKNWKIVDPNGFRRRYNNAQTAEGRQTVTEQEFTKVFNNNAVPTFNNDRAAVLNNPDNYASVAISEGNRAAFFQKNIPLVKDPRTGLMVSSTGVKQTQPTQNTQNPPASGGNNEPVISAAATQEELNESVEKGRYDRGGKDIELRYPVENTGPFQFDYVAIKAYDYKASGLGFDYSVDKNIKGQGYERVVLPMQPQISETNGVNWSDDQLNPIQAMLGKFAASSIDAAGSLIDFSKFTQNMGNAFSDLKTDVEEALRDPNTAKFITAYFAGQAVGANVIGRQTGMVINPNLELLFNGPNLRTFNYNFKLTPRSAKESEMCKKIIRAFKRNMAVSRSASNLFLQSPRIFKIEYFFKEDIPHPYLNKIKPCALTNFNVNYTPDGSYSTFDETGSMTQFEINMAFTEVMPIYAEDLDENDDATMGY